MKLSIITINKNNREGLRRTIESVVSQTFQEFEYIVIDGASTDGSAELIPEYPRIDYSVSEPDTGIYNAMNKGIARATGEYLLFLNSGDELVAKTILQTSIQHVKPDINFIYFDYLRSDGIQIQQASDISLNISDLFLSNICHQTIFYHKCLFSKYGTYSCDYKYYSDWERNIDLICNHNVKAVHIPLVLVKYDIAGISATSVHISHMDMETFKIVFKSTHFTFFPLQTRNSISLTHGVFSYYRQLSLCKNPFKLQKPPYLNRIQSIFCILLLIKRHLLS